MNRLIRIVLASLGICSGCSKSGVLTPAEFTRECVKALHKHSSSVKVEVVRDLELRLVASDGREFTSYLYNAYDLYKLDPTANAELIDRFVTASLEAFPNTPDGLDRTRVVPIIKDRPWLAESREALRKRGVREGPEQVYEDFNGDLVVLYAEDLEKNIHYFAPKALAAAKIEKAELRALACENLKRLLPKIECHGSNGFYMITAGGNYEASLLLLDSIWDDGQLVVQGDIVVAIPTRDVLLVTGSEYPEGIVKIKEMVQDAYTKGAYKLTPKLFVRRDSHFTEFEDGASADARPITGPPRE